MGEKNVRSIAKRIEKLNIKWKVEQCDHIWKYIERNIQWWTSVVAAWYNHDNRILIETQNKRFFC